MEQGIKLRRRLLEVLKGERFADCKFLVGGSGSHSIVISAHKQILAAVSPVFEALFFGDLKDTREIIPLDDICPDTFQLLLHFIYCHELPLEGFSIDLAIELFSIARKYFIEDVETICLNYIRANVAPANVCKTLEFASFNNELNDMGDLWQTSMMIIRMETESVLRSADFMEAELNIVSIIMDQNELNVESELELFYALERYAEANDLVKENSAKTSSISIYDLVKKIRFLAMTPEEWVLGANSKLLSEAEKAKIAVALIADNSTQSLPDARTLPDGFSTEKSREIFFPENLLRRLRILAKKNLNVKCSHCGSTGMDHFLWKCPHRNKNRSALIKSVDESGMEGDYTFVRILAANNPNSIRALCRFLKENDIDKLSPLDSVK